MCLTIRNYDNRGLPFSMSLDDSRKITGAREERKEINRTNKETSQMGLFLW